MPTPSNTRSRQLSYANPVMYNGSLYPSTEDTIEQNGTVHTGRIFADSNGQYFTINSQGRAVPATVQNILPEVTVLPSRQEMLADAFNGYLTIGNDNTRVLNSPHREYNPHLTSRTIRGAKEHNLWEQQHPNASSWSYAAAAAPFAVVAAPAAISAGQALAGTSLGQTATHGIERLMATPIVEAANAGLGLGSAAHGVYDVAQGRFTPSTALDFMGGVSLFTKNGLGLTRKYLGNGSFSGESYLPINARKTGAERYIDFVHSQEYQNRLKNAGMKRYSEDIENLTNKRLNGSNYFPGRLQETILRKPKTLGLSGIGIFNPYRGITIKKSLYPNRMTPTLDHELSHWVTKNTGVKDKGFLGDIMRYNEGIAPNSSFTDFLIKKAKSNPKMKIPEREELKKLEDTYNYLIDPQEKRARAYSIYQQAKDYNINTDEMVDMFTTPDGVAVPYAPQQLNDMTYMFTPSNLKKYLNRFLGIAAPVGISTPLLYNKK